MLSLLLSIAALGALVPTTFAAPAPALSRILNENPTPVEKRQGSVVASELAIIESLLSVGVVALGQKAAFSAVVSELEAIIPTASPTATEDVPSMLSSIYAAATPTGYRETAVYLLLNGLTSSEDLIDTIKGESIGENSPSNTANPTPTTTVYPKKEPCDAPYSQSEATLREQIYIPSTFTFGQKPPVILFPGTGGRGGLNFAGNFEVTLADVSYADLVWVNPTSFLLADAQLNSELAAYAINYISAISGNVNVSLIAWSQGNINIQWATKYWPSTRLIVSDHIAISPDYHGTTLAELIDPGNDILYAPPVLQQEYNSNFIATLRSNGGDSAYVPTTNIYSAIFDEIVEPQQNPNASAILLDARNVGVTNAEIQAVCGVDSPAGFFQDHESMLASSLAYALAVDALTHDGPGLISRIDLTTVCQEVIAPGLDLADFLATENDILVAVAALLLYPSPVKTEPKISAYATLSPTTCASTSTKTSSTKKTTSTTKTSLATSTKKASTISSAKLTSTTSSTKKISTTSSTKKITFSSTTSKTQATATHTKA